jgi:flagellar motor protein MotB
MAIHVEEEGGNGYFASVSDLMVGILFVFLLMLTVFALNYREAEHDQEISRARFEATQRQALLAAEEAQVQAERAETAKRQALLAEEKAHHLRHLLEDAATEVRREIEDRASARNRLLRKLERALTDRSIPVRIDWEAGILHLQESILFQPSDATLGSEQRKTVASLADALARTLPCFTAVPDRHDCEPDDLPVLETVLIEGHTDKRPISNRRYRDNEQLSTERALAVFEELLRVQRGLDELRNAEGTYPLLGVSGFGARRPLAKAQGDTEGDYALNRRIDLRLILAARSSVELERLRSEIEKALKESEN